MKIFLNHLNTYLISDFKMTLTKIDHKFTYPQLSYDAKPNIQPCIKLTFYFNKLPNVSYEQFYGHWSTVHADLTVASNGFAAQKIQRYVQVDTHFLTTPTSQNTNPIPRSPKSPSSKRWQNS